MILRDEWFRFDDRCLSHPGVILDLGCFSWDWSKYFFDKGKRVIGFDLQETIHPPSVEFRKQAVMPFAIEQKVRGTNAYDSSVMLSFGDQPGVAIETVSLDSILAEFSIMPSLLKMNIEGAEFPLLFSLKEPPTDQLIVSFHDFGNLFPFPKQLSEMVRNQLSIWYDWTCTSREYSWWMGLLKEEFRTL